MTEKLTTSTVLLEKPPVTHLLKNFPTFYGTRRFITVFTRAATGPYLDPDRSSPYYPTLFLYDTF
jgi:hypothetical protein